MKTYLQASEITHQFLTQHNIWTVFLNKYSQAFGELLEVLTETQTDHKSKNELQGTSVVHQSQVPSSSFMVESFGKAGFSTVTAT